MKKSLMTASLAIGFLALTACKAGSGIYVPPPDIDPIIIGGGYNDGYDDGYNDGSYDGYDDGYNDGYDDGSYDSGGYDDGGYDSGGYDDGSYSGGDTGGCDSSGCNSFGSGGSKNTGLLASKVTKAQMQAKAQSIASQFQMSYDSAYKLTQLAVQVQGMKQQRQLTQADRDAVTQSALKIAGVSGQEVNNAITKSVSTGDQTAIEDVMSKAAQNLGMPSAQTFRDKLLPLLSTGAQK